MLQRAELVERSWFPEHIPFRGQQVHPSPRGVADEKFYGGPLHCRQLSKPLNPRVDGGTGPPRLVTVFHVKHHETVLPMLPD